MPLVLVDCTAVAALAPNSLFSMALYLRRAVSRPAVSALRGPPRLARDASRDAAKAARLDGAGATGQVNGHTPDQVATETMEAQEGYLRLRRNSQDGVAISLHVDEVLRIWRVQAHVLQGTEGSYQNPGGEIRPCAGVRSGII